MAKRHLALLLLPAALCLLFGCDKGLAPITEDTGFSGVITFKNWPPPDSVLELRLVAFEVYPSDSSGIFNALLNGQAAVYPHVTTGVAGALEILGNRSADTVRYAFTTEGTILKKDATYNYVVLGWRYGPNYFADWAPAGVYTETPGTFVPASVTVRDRRMRKDVNITVDFHNLPPKPWK
ncbi:MAG: hypothetical protein IT282_03160 [Bacteroidetes bacterium]|nr:hypothetical protein [Bacteroidota bacterium]